MAIYLAQGADLAGAIFPRKLGWRLGFQRSGQITARIIRSKTDDGWRRAIGVHYPSDRVRHRRQPENRVM